MEERLRKFASLVDAGSYTRASRELHISQPALTAAVQKLERELNATLLIRGTRPLKLTEAGHLAYAAAKELSVRLSNLKTQLAELAHEQVPIAIGMIDSVAALLFMHEANIAQLEAHTKMSVDVNNSRYLLHAVEHEQLDAAFVAERPSPLSGLLEATYVGSEAMVLVCHASQADVVNQALKEGRLSRFISYDQPSTTHRLIREGLQAHGIEPEPVFFSTSPDVMLRLVQLKKGVAVLPYSQVQEYVHSGTLVLAGGDMPLVIARRISLVKRRDRDLAPALTEAVQTVRNLLDHQQAPSGSGQ
jgi:LysR family transcriptional regulator, transcriptional activator of the cysJI operon